MNDLTLYNKYCTFYDREQLDTIEELDEVFPYRGHLSGGFFVFPYTGIEWSLELYSDNFNTDLLQALYIIGEVPGKLEFRVPNREAAELMGIHGMSTYEITDGYYICYKELV